MTDEDFTIYARGAQAWDKLVISVGDNRIFMELDGTAIALTKIQSEELVKWLTQPRAEIRRYRFLKLLEETKGDIH